MIRTIGLILSVFISISSALAETAEIPNPLIDSRSFLADTIKAQELRESRRVTEKDFLRMANEKGTIILDARSGNRFEQMHIVGAKNLSFTDFTKDTLAAAILSKDTRILIYCNNNIANQPVAFASKAPQAALNLSTFVSLYSYGYRNVYELGPVIDPANSTIEFEGALRRAPPAPSPILH